MKKTTIDASLLPKIWLQWDTTKGRFYFNCATGEKQDTHEPWMYNRAVWNKNTHNLFTSGANIIFAYAKYHEDIECLEVAAVRMDSTRKPAVHEWKYESKYFIKKDKTIIDENGVEHGKKERYYVDKNHTAYDFKNYLSIITRFHYTEKLLEEFKKFIGNNFYTIGNGRVINIQWAWHIQDWYAKQTTKVRGAGKQQKLTDMLVAMPLSDATDFNGKYPIVNVYKYDEYHNRNIEVKGIMYFERVNDEWSVIRMFNREHGGPIYECERMYMNDDGTNRIVSYNNNSWMPSKIYQSRYGVYYRFVNRDEAMAKCNRLKYIIPLFDEDSIHMRENIITTLYFPEIEQLIKLGYGNYAKYLMSSSTIRADIKHTFGGCYNEKETSLFRKVGLTKHQFEVVAQGLNKKRYYYYNSWTKEPIEKVRNFFGDEFAHLDNDSFDEYYKAFSKIDSYYVNADKLAVMGVDYKRFIKNLVRLGKKNENVYIIAKDALCSYNGLNHGTHPEINWYFDSYSDVVRAHDALDALKREQWAQRQALYNMAEAERQKKLEEKRKKLDEERKKYEYEDDNFIIRLPKDGNEIIREGSMQRICIGGYVQNHSSGSTNLFFLRKKSEPDMPFYAIEMKNDMIIQIHGYCNKWLGNNPEAIPTVVRWLRKNGISCSENILTCTATGYGSNGHYIQMPVVD